VQKIYEIQGVAINPKHLEIIARLMVTRPQTGGQGCRSGFSAEEGKPELRGITEVALSANSFLASAAFQSTAKILAEAAVMGRQDNFQGIRENVMIGKLIPAGTGFVSPAESPS
jgi:DNA-directed RNA polymerase subunit beta'